jgi:phenylalanine-4-hydroxylase
MRIDDFEESYFVIVSFEGLFAQTTEDFAEIYHKLETELNYKPGDVLSEDRVHTHGRRTYVGGRLVRSSRQ